MGLYFEVWINIFDCVLDKVDFLFSLIHNAILNHRLDCPWKLQRLSFHSLLDLFPFLCHYLELLKQLLIYQFFGFFGGISWFSDLSYRWEFRIPSLGWSVESRDWGLLTQSPIHASIILFEQVPWKRRWGNNFGDWSNFDQILRNFSFYSPGSILTLKRGRNQRFSACVSDKVLSWICVSHVVSDLARRIIKGPLRLLIG